MEQRRSAAREKVDDGAGDDGDGADLRWNGGDILDVPAPTQKKSEIKKNKIK